MEKERAMRRLTKGLIAAALLAAAGITVNGSSHREALAILNEPCADNTDTYAWVSNGLQRAPASEISWSTGSSSPRGCGPKRLQAPAILSAAATSCCGS